MNADVQALTPFLLHLLDQATSSGRWAGLGLRPRRTEHHKAACDKHPLAEGRHSPVGGAYPSAERYPSINCIDARTLTPQQAARVNSCTGHAVKAEPCRR